MVQGFLLHTSFCGSTRSSARTLFIPSTPRLQPQGKGLQAPYAEPISPQDVPLQTPPSSTFAVRGSPRPSPLSRAPQSLRSRHLKALLAGEVTRGAEGRGSVWVGAIDPAAFGSRQLGAGDSCNQTQTELVRMDQAQPPLAPCPCGTQGTSSPATAEACA